MGLHDVTVHDERSLQDIADTLARSHRILLVTGAGISTSCGIPDFRSKDGLYNMIPNQTMLPTPPSSQPSTPTHHRVVDLTLDEESSTSQQSRSRRASASPSSRLRGQDLFDSRVFQNAESTTVFYKFVASMRQKIRDEVHQTSSVHKFVRVLRDGGRLMRCYTQNIDGLEAREGLVTDLRRGKGNRRRLMKKHFEVPRPVQTVSTDFDGGCEVVQLHGDLDKLRCNMCSTQYEWSDDETEIYLEGAAPKCPKCAEKSDDRRKSGKRGLAIGSLRPNIVLYGEDHPSNTLLTPLIPFDAGSQPEVLIIMGTSLKVFGLQKIVREFAKAVHSQKHGDGRVIFVNRTRPSESMWEGVIDDYVAMDCDEWVEDLKQRRHDLWLRQGEIGAAVKKSPIPSKKRKAENEVVDKENRPLKKPKIVVEIPKPQGSPRKKLVPKDLKAPLTHPARAILSPLAQAQRPPTSPFTSPIRPDEAPTTPGLRRRRTPIRPSISPFPSPIYPHKGESNAHSGTPKRPFISPFTPAMSSRSKLGMQLFPDDGPDENIPSSPYDRGLGHNHMLTSSPPVAEHEASELAKKENINFVRQLFKKTGGGRDLIEKQQPKLVEKDVAFTKTPSRGPKGRKIDVYAE
jgi:NAD+-dependent protein deacetylase SIR2